MNSRLEAKIDECSMNQSTVLDLTGYGIDSIPSSIGKLKHLKILRLDKNRISRIEELEGLDNLEVLSLERNAIRSIRAECIPISVEMMWLNGNEIEEISDIETLENLKELFLHDNSIEKIDANLLPMSLEELRLSDNPLKHVNNIGHLNNLKILDIQNTSIKELKSLGILIRKGLNVNEKNTDIAVLEEGIFVYKCDFHDTPREVLKQGNKSILNFWKQLLDQGQERLFECKVLIVGEAGAGKTTLHKKILDPDYKVPNSEKSTVGINIFNNWMFDYKLKEATEINKYSCNIWDFGGQEIQYMTHQYFLTSDSLYVLVAEDRKQHTEFDYWFRIIRLLGISNTENTCKVLVVLNENNHKSITNFDLGTYQDRFPELVIEKLEVDFSLNDYRFSHLIERLKFSVAMLPHIGSNRPKFWRNIRERLDTLKYRKHMSWQEFKDICERENLVSEENQLVLSSYLHNLGEIIHYQEDIYLADFIILDPEWATKAVYSVLEDTHVLDNNGRVDLKYLRKRWKKYTFLEQSKLVRLLEVDKYEISFKINNSDAYLIPQLLPYKRPDFNWGDSPSTKIRYKYPFLPKGVLSRVIVRLHQYVLGELMWKFGIVLSKDSAIAKITQDKTRDEGIEIIDVDAIGFVEDRKFIMKVISDEIESIHQKSFPKLNVIKMIPCNCDTCISSNSPTYYEFEELVQYRREEEKFIKCRKGKLKNVSVFSLLGELKDFESTYKPVHLSNIFDEILNSLKNDNIEKALNLMYESEVFNNNSSNLDVIIQLRGQYARVYKDKLLRLRSNESITIELNQIVSSILLIVNQVKTSANFT